MKNKLTDLNDHLFMQMERLNNEELQGEKLAAEIRRAEALTDVAAQIIANGALVLKARIAGGGLPAGGSALPPMLIG
jgi:hypothetical protein